MLPVTGSGFLGWFWIGFDRKSNVNGPKAGPKLPGFRLGRFGTGFCSVHIRFPAKTGPGRPAERTGNIIEQPKVLGTEPGYRSGHKADGGSMRPKVLGTTFGHEAPKVMPT